ncbi:MAG: hypothetical protein WD049_01470 [Candidatus Paceibacterota bacterium]
MPTKSLPDYPTVTHQEKLTTERSWWEHFEHLEAEGIISVANLRSWLYASTHHDKIGYEGNGMIRPGDLGRWDLFFPLYQEWGVGKKVAARIANVTIEEANAEMDADRHY